MEKATKTFTIRVLATFMSMSLALSGVKVHGHCHHYIDVCLPSDIPKALEPPAATRLLGAYWAAGYQEYTFNGTQWLNTNVSADLMNKNGERIGHHKFVYLPFLDIPRPHWASYHNFSMTVCEKVAVVPQNSSIPLLLLGSIMASGDPMYYGRTAYVQRLLTSKGLPPDSSLNATSGQVFKSEYSALYAFYRTIRTDVGDGPAPSLGA
ncbi:hypothetical protein Mapa_012285 [Marchantia paleacea]|nr:hypothetical protein Mapa_012285 [Marchantia paleacea]